MKKKKLGDCYRVAGNAVIENDNFLLCHAIVAGQGKLKGQWIEHAWNELGDMVFDSSNGKQIVMRKEKYYKLGKIKKVRKYTSKEARELMLKHKTFGPWDKVTTDE